MNMTDFSLLRSFHVVLKAILFNQKLSSGHMCFAHAQLSNPQRMHEGDGSRSVSLSVTKLAATNLICKLKSKCH